MNQQNLAFIPGTNNNALPTVTDNPISYIVGSSEEVTKTFMEYGIIFLFLFMVAALINQLTRG